MVIGIVERRSGQYAVVADRARAEIRGAMQRLAIDRPLKRLAEFFAVTRILLAQIETEVFPAEADLFRNHELVVLPQARDVLQRQRFRELHATRTQLAEAL